MASMVVKLLLGVKSRFNGVAILKDDNSIGKLVIVLVDTFMC